MKPSELLARVRARKPVASPAPAKRPPKGVTYGELDGAIAAVFAEMGDCSARQTLNAFYGMAAYARCDIVMFEGPAPVSCAQFDQALAEVRKFELPKSTLRPLERVRDLLAHLEAKASREPPQHVTVAQLKAFEAAMYDMLGWAVGAVAAELDRSQPSKAHLLSMLGRSANTAERRKMLDAANTFDESKVPQRTQAEWLRYQSMGPR